MHDIETRIKDAELAGLKAFEATESPTDAAALWLALSRSVDDSARIRIRELGGDPDSIREALDRFSIENPNTASA